MQAAATTPDSTESSSRRGGGGRRVKTAVTSPGSAGSGRVLRARGALSCSPEESKDAQCKEKSPSPLRGRGKPAGESCKDTPVQNFSDPDASLDDHISFRDDLNDLTFIPDSNIFGSRLCPTLQKEVKTEEEEDIKQESTEISVQSEDEEGDFKKASRKRRRQPKDHDDSSPRKRRKKPPAQYVRCDIEGCGAVLAHPRYLQHHIKYQHLLKKIYRCDYPACGRLFRLQKQLLRHAKHHTDQRDFICEFCARAFKSAHNLAVHKMIHTGEKPIQCEICGFTCRQKASLNWHMKKHDAAASYQFSCSVCDKKFEKKDSVVAHMTKSHPSVLIAEALEASGGEVISNAITGEEKAPVPTPSDIPSDSKGSQEVEGETQTPVENVELPLVSQPQMDPPLPPQPQVDPPLPPHPQVDPPLPPHPQVEPPFSPHPQVESPLPPQPQMKLPIPRLRPMKPRMNVHPCPMFQLPTHQVLQVAHQPQPPTVLHLTTPSPTHLSGTQFIQLATLPISTITATPAANHHSNVITLSPVSALTSTASVAPQQGLQWKTEAQEDAHVPGEGELWDRVVVGSEEMMWEGNEAKREVDEERIWEKKGERDFFTGC